MSNPILNSYYRDNLQHISQHNIQSYNHFFKNNFIKLIEIINDNSKIIKRHKNFQLEVQVFIGGENIDQLYLYPPLITWEQQNQQEETKGGGKTDKQRYIDNLLNQLCEIRDQYGDQVYQNVTLQDNMQNQQQDYEMQSTSSDVDETSSTSSRTSSDSYNSNSDENDSSSSNDSNESNSDYSSSSSSNSSSSTKSVNNAYSKNIKNKVLDNVINKLGDQVPILKKESKKKFQRNNNNIPVNFKDIIKGGKSIDKEQDTIQNKKRNKYLYPNEARLKNLSYQSQLVANIVVQYKYYQTTTTKGKETSSLINEHKMTFQQQTLCYLPIMLKSCLCILNNKSVDFLRYVGECPYDQGGYFIIDGQEKVIVAQERFALNKLFVQLLKDSNKKFQCEGLIRSTSQQDVFFPKTVDIKQYRDDISKRRNAICIYMSFDGGILGKSKDVEIPIYVIFRALNIENDIDIKNIINPLDEDNVNKILYYCRLDNHNIYDQQSAFQYIQDNVTGLTKEGVQGGLINFLFPNLQDSFYNKAMFLGKVIFKFIKTSIGEIQPTDKDSMFIKRIDTGGQLYENMIRDIFNKYRDIGRTNFDNLLTVNQSLPFEKLVQYLNMSNFGKIFSKNFIQENIEAQMKGKYGRIVFTDRDGNRQILKEARNGVVQDISRFSYLLYIDLQRKVINYQESDDIKVVGPHLLHCSQFGYLCPTDTPDGQDIGVHKHLATLAMISTYISSDGAIELCKDLGIIEMQNCTQQQLNENINIYVNSMFYGVYEGQMNIDQLLYYLLLIKRNGLLNITTSISANYQSNEINILSDSGRAIRPLIILKNNEHVFNQSLVKKLNNQEITWQDLIYGGTYKMIDDFDPQQKIQESYYISPKDVFKTDDLLKLVKFMEQCQCAIEYLDHEMAENALIAIDTHRLQANEMQLPKFLAGKKDTHAKGTQEGDYYLYTHLEIDPSTLLSPVQNHAPFLNHNQSNRNLLSCQQTKQSIGLPYTNYKNRLDTQCYILHNPQRSLCSSIYQQYYNTNNLGFGFNTFVAIMTYGGQNQEDAVIFNKGSVERGLFDITYFKSFSESEELNNKQKIVISFQKDNTIDEYFDQTDENGLPKLGAVLTHEDDIILSKIRKIVQTTIQKSDVLVEQKEVVNESFINKKVKNKYIGFTVDKVFVFLNQSGVNEVKVRLRQYRKIELGDKVASRQAQKGVVGGFLESKDMPYTQDGEVPDLIITPNAFPTRMTVSYFIEAVFSKIALRSGTFMDSTAFNYDKDIIKNSAQILTQLDANSKCQKIFYNGFTGDQIRGDILYAPIFYMRLKQMAADKISARSGAGKLDKNTRTPVEGRSQGGATKIGNMEVDALQAHGVQNFIKESLFQKSNLFILQLCNDCGRLAQYKGLCSHCHGTNIRGLDGGYSYKQFLQELNQMHIKCTFDVEDNEQYNN